MAGIRFKRLKLKKQIQEQIKRKKNCYNVYLKKNWYPTCPVIWVSQLLVKLVGSRFHQICPL